MSRQKKISIYHHDTQINPSDDIFVSPLFRTHLPAPQQVCDSLELAAHGHTSVPVTKQMLPSAQFLSDVRLFSFVYDNDASQKNQEE